MADKNLKTFSDNFKKDLNETDSKAWQMLKDTAGDAVKSATDILTGSNSDSEDAKKKKKAGY